LHPTQAGFACFRKYIGVRGMGDFSLVTRHPRVVLDHDAIVHSHTNPAYWLASPPYDSYAHFASVRHPCGIINSALFSLNALASEYIQRFLPPGQDNDEMRQTLALYKFTDLSFFRGIAKFYANWFRDFMPVRNRFTLMRWEDLMQEPVTTISTLAASAGLPISEGHAMEIWARLDHVNLTGAHKHNYRSGKGVVGDWRNWMTNHHIQILRDAGLEEVAQAFGYSPFPILEEKAYSPFQREIDQFIRKGKVFTDHPDLELFGFAFNKSNLVSDHFPFRRFGWRDASQVERSTFTDEAMMGRVWDAVDAAACRLNRIFAAAAAGGYETRTEALASLDTITAAAGDIAPCMPKAHVAMTPALTGLVDAAFTHGIADDTPPQLIRSIGHHNIVRWRNKYFRIPQALGSFELDKANLDDLPGLIQSDRFGDVDGVPVILPLESEGATTIIVK
jgi:hypothetical protein